MSLKQRLCAVAFGMLPDAVSFLPLNIYLLFHVHDIHSHFSGAGGWTYTYGIWSYNYTHSLVIWALATVLVMLVRKGRVYWPMFGWLVHILLDIPTHPDRFKTPLLFPLSTTTNHYAISWHDVWFVVINYGALVFIYLYWFLVLKKKRVDLSVGIRKIRPSVDP